MLRPEVQSEIEGTRKAMASLRAAVLQLGKGLDPKMATLARDLAHMRVWPNGRRPDWWSNQELRVFLTESHRQMTLAQCCAEVERRFKRPFSTATLQRYWALLDGVLGQNAGSDVSQNTKRKAA